MRRHLKNMLYPLPYQNRDSAAHGQFLNIMLIIFSIKSYVNLRPVNKKHAFPAGVPLKKRVSHYFNRIVIAQQAVSPHETALCQGSVPKIREAGCMLPVPTTQLLKPAS